LLNDVMAGGHDAMMRRRAASAGEPEEPPRRTGAIDAEIYQLFA